MPRSFRSLSGRLLVAAAAVALVHPALCREASDHDTEEAGQVALHVAKLLEQGHFTRAPLDDTKSAELFQNYIEALDYTRLYFTQQDIDALRTKYEKELDDYLLLGNPKPAYEIHDLYLKRVEERTAKINELLKEKFTFDSNEKIILNRQKAKAPWPKDEAEADALWRKRIEAELLQERLNDDPTDAPEVVVKRRHSTILKNLKSLDRRDILDEFLSTLSQTYDPHSEYMGPSELANFEISMRLSLVGIGAMLRSEDGYAKIVDLVPGGPAQVDGRLKVNDRISAVAQGDEPFVDTVEMKLDKVVQLIRGEKGTKVRLQVLPAGNASAGRKVVEIIRDEIKLTEQEAKAEIIEHRTSSGKIEKLGWVTLPSFYAEMGKGRSRDSKSTTRDVERLIERLKKEGIEGMVLDLRRNGGGSLEEAVNLTGLFIKSGPVVQAKDTTGSVTTQRDRDARVVWDGPLIVLTSRLSASASEILAGALQDYGRAVIVGDESTFGKGTVQTMLDLSRFMPWGDPSAENAGSLKLTVQQFYRVSGASTQLQGVISDIHLPTLTDNPEIGESALKAPLPFDQIDSLRIQKWHKPLFLDELRERSKQRVAKSREFQWVVDDFNRVKEKLERNVISLNEAERRAEIEEDKKRKEARIAARKAANEKPDTTYEITLENVDEAKLIPVSLEQKARERAERKAQIGGEKEDEEPEFDAERAETLEILADLVELSRAPQTASVTKE